MTDFPLNQRIGTSPLIFGSTNTAPALGPTAVTSYYTSPLVPRIESFPHVTQSTKVYYPPPTTYSVPYEVAQSSPIANRSEPRVARALSIGSAGTAESSLVRAAQPIFAPTHMDVAPFANDPYHPHWAPQPRNPPRVPDVYDAPQRSRGYRGPSPFRAPSPAAERPSPRGWGPTYPRYHVPQYSPQRPARHPSASRRRGEYQDRYYRSERSRSESYYTGKRRDPPPPPDPDAERQDKARRVPVEQRWKGTLNARVIRATDLRRPGGTTHGTCVEVSVVGARFQSDAVRTDTVTDQVMPLWDQAVVFSCPLEQREGELISLDELDVRVLDIRMNGEEEAIGGGTVPLSTLVKGRQTPMTVDLMGQGFLHLILEAIDFGHGKRISEVGNLLVRVLSGQGVTNGDVVGGLPDTYVVVSSMGQEFQTRIQWNTRDPEWNEDFPFRVPVAARPSSLLGCDSYLNVQVYDRNSGRPGVDAYLGGAQVSLEGLEHQRPTPAPVELKAGGTVLLQLVALSFGVYRPQQGKR